MRLTEGAVQRTARKTYRCTCADDVVGWEVVASYATANGSGQSSWFFPADAEEQARDAAAAKIGTVAAWNVKLTPPVPSATYGTAEVRPRLNRNAASRSPECAGTIEPGDRYVEYVAGGEPYGSGPRYCQPCGEAAWGREDAQ